MLVAALRRRAGRVFDLALLPALLLFSGAVLDWRADGLAGYGLRREVVAAGGTSKKADLDPWVGSEGAESAAPSVRWSGTLVTPRSGDHHFFVRLEDHGARSALRIDGQVYPSRPWRGDGHRYLAVLRAGGHRIELEIAGVRGGGTRLLWSPARPGASPEVLPPTLLFPSSEGPSATLRAYALGPRDATAVFALVGALLLVVLLWLRRSLRCGLALLRRESWARLDLLLTLGLFALALGLRLWDGAALGPTLGEGPLAARAHNVLQLLLAGRFDPLSWSWASAQPGLGAAWIAAPSALALGVLGAGRELMAVVGALTCALLFLVAREGVGRGVGLVAAALAVVLPPLWAYQRLLDPAAPATLFYLLSMWFFLRGLRLGLPVGAVAVEAVGPPVSRPALGVDGSGYFIWAGVAAGLAIAISPNAISLLAAQIVLYAVVALRRRSTGALALPPSLALSPLVLLAVFVMLHPPLWQAPLHELGLLLLALGKPPEPEFFYGALRVPTWSYAPSYLLAILPVGVVSAAAVGLLRVLWRREVGGLAALVWLGAALALLRPAGGAQAVLPALPVVCLLGAAGVDGVSRLIVRLLHRPLWRLPLTALAGAVLTVYVLLATASVHPYQLDYYGELHGGPVGVARDKTFVIGWRGEGLDEALAYVARQAPRGASLCLDVRHPERARLRADLRLLPKGQAADFLVRDGDAGRAAPPGYRRAYAVRAAAATLLTVFRR